MFYDRLSRRHILRGLGAALTLPLLPSLTPKAHAAAPLPRFFVSMWHGHGGISLENTYPIYGTTLSWTTWRAATSSEPQHVVNSGRLTSLKRTHASTAAQRQQALPDYDNGAARVSPVLGSFFTDAMLDKMNVVLGVDYLWTGGHNHAALGASRVTGALPTGRTAAPVPSIDHVISQSAAFYSAAERVLLKAPSVGLWGGTSLSAYPSGTSTADNPFGGTTIGALYQLLFDGVSGAPSAVDPRVSLVDRVRSQYQALVSSGSTTGRRISLEDKRRLDQYMENVKGISDRMRAIAGFSCNLPTAPTAAEKKYLVRQPDYQWGAGTPTDEAGQMALQQATLELSNMLLVHAFQCGTTRIAVQQLPGLHVKWNPNHFNDAPTSGATDTHQQLFHRFEEAARQQYLIESQRFFMRYALLDLAQRMQAIEVSPGVSMLDQSVVYWTAECGPVTHWAVNSPTITLGSGGGYFKTGNFLDLRNMARPVLHGANNPFFFGVPHNQVLANFCQAMGLSAADYELSDALFPSKFPSRGGKVPGYGDPGLGFSGFTSAPFTTNHLNAMSEKLPVIT